MASTDEPPWKPKAVVFDLLTALLDSWSLWDAATPSQSAAEGRPWRQRYLELTFGQGAYAPYEELVRRAAADVGLLAAAPDFLINNWGSLLPWPEAPAALVRLRRQGCRLGVVTNCSAQLGRAAADNLCTFVHAQLGDEADGFAWDAVVTAEESGFYKPVPAAYDAVLPKLGAAAGEIAREDVLFVAGSAFDVQGATDAGFKVCWHNRIGMRAKGEARPLREAMRLDEVLQDFLKDDTTDK